jgi:hypothetical protein
MAADMAAPWRLAVVHRHDISHIGLTWRFGQNRSLAVKIGQKSALAAVGQRRSTPDLGFFFQIHAGQRRLTSDLGFFFHIYFRSSIDLGFFFHKKFNFS